jgi:hypothetical protein
MVFDQTGTMETLIHVKHITGDIDGVRCSIVESGITKERCLFLTDLLKHNGLEVKTQQDPPAEGKADVTFTIGVTDIIFNAVYSIYEMQFKRPDGKVVTPAYWRQESGDTTGWYWTFGKKGVADYYE